MNRRDLLSSCVCVPLLYMLPKKNTLSKNELHQCDIAARIMINSLVSKLPPSHIIKNKLYVFSDKCMYKVKRVGVYCWVECDSMEGYCSIIDVDMDKFPSIVTNKGIEMCLKTTIPIHKEMISRSEYYWTQYTLFNKE